MKFVYKSIVIHLRRTRITQVSLTLNYTISEQNSHNFASEKRSLSIKQTEGREVACI